MFIRTASLLKKGTKTGEPLDYLTEDRFVINGDRTIRERSIITVVNATQNIVSREISKFEYGIDFKPIEAPIK